MLWGPILLLVGCGFSGLAVMIFRREAHERRLFRGAIRVTGEVVEIRAEEPETARIRYCYEGREYFLVRSGGWNSEYNSWDSSGHRLGDRLFVLVPLHRPQGAALPREIRDLYLGPGGFAILGVAALGFGLLLVTESLAVASPLLAAAVVGGIAMATYSFFLEGRRAEPFSGLPRQEKQIPTKDNNQRL